MLSITHLLLLRVIRAWNQTGQKHAGEPDISRTVLPAHAQLLWCLVATTYIDVASSLSQSLLSWVPKGVSVTLTLALCLASLGFKISFTLADAPELLAGFPQVLCWPTRDIPLPTQARAVFLLIGMLVSLTVFGKITDRNLASRKTGVLHELLTIFLLTQSRSVNIPLFLLFKLQLRLLAALKLSANEVIVTSLAFQYVSFFALGNSNGISSIDLSNAYNGVRGYNVAVVGLLTFLDNWSGPLWWTSATNLVFAAGHSASGQNVATKKYFFFTTFSACHILAVMLACTALRAHLFVWTVFSPKYLYSMAWCLGQHLCINILYSGVVTWISNR